MMRGVVTLLVALVCLGLMGLGSVLVLVALGEEIPVNMMGLSEAILGFGIITVGFMIWIAYRVDLMIARQSAADDLEKQRMRWVVDQINKPPQQ